MKIMNGKHAALVGLLAMLVAGCQPPSDPPPDILKTQREALNKAKALDGQVKQQAQDRMNAVDEAQK